MDGNYDVTYKIILVGDTSVGKTMLLGSFTSPDQETFNGVSSSFSTSSKPTIGVEFSSKRVVVADGTAVLVHLWDTAGQERYSAIVSSHYKRAAGALVVYDATKPETLTNATDRWLRQLRRMADDEEAIMQCVSLVGNKTDLPQQTATAELHEEAATSAGFPLNARTSAKTGDGVTAAFEALVNRVHEQHARKRRNSLSGGFTLDGRPRKAADAGSGCCT
mmetsp:Transcript_20135/g.68274  ORF Transcript_20135/g.68274 Transcript_20135/m.68274 type:complete len:220 (+) Transcript_20135:37-696(+)